MIVVELVRHAKALTRDRWWGKPDRERPLTDEGEEQARMVARELLAGERITALYSSPLARCRQTLEPLAHLAGLDIVDEPVLGEASTLPVLDGGDAWVGSAWLGGRAVAFLDRVIDAHDGERVVACSHGDILPAVMAVLTGRDDLPLDDVRLRKGGRFTLTFDGRRCVRAVATRPPDSDP
jgi:broad specificity phosphatase PhoE